MSDKDKSYPEVTNPVSLNHSFKKEKLKIRSLVKFRQDTNNLDKGNSARSFDPSPQNSLGEDADFMDSLVFNFNNKSNNEKGMSLIGSLDVNNQNKIFEISDDNIHNEESKGLQVPD